MATSKTDIKQLAEEVLTILKEDGWTADSGAIQDKLAAKGITASLRDIIRIIDAIRTIHTLIAEFSFGMQSPLEPK